MCVYLNMYRVRRLGRIIFVYIYRERGEYTISMCVCIGIQGISSINCIRSIEGVSTVLQSIY